MKTRIITILTFYFFCMNIVAEEIPVNPDTFIDKWEAASDGDVLLMEAGKYGGTYALQSYKTITLKAHEGDEVVLISGPKSDSNTHFAGFVVDGLTLKLESGNHFMDFSLGDSTRFEFKNTIITDINRCFMYPNGGGAIKSIEFDNCIIKDCGNGGYNFIWVKVVVERLSITNSTLYNYAGENIFAPDSGQNHNIFTFTFENNTVYKWSRGHKNGDLNHLYAFCKIEGKYNSQSTYIVRNNIIAEPGVEGVTPLILQVSSGNFICENNLIVNYGGYDIEDSTFEAKDFNLENFGLESIGFANPEEEDFTLEFSSPLAQAGLGDPRWIKLPEDVNRVLTMYADGGFETICLPFDVMSILNEKGEEVHPINLLQYDSNNGSTVNFVESEMIQANIPYLIALPKDDTLVENVYTFMGTVVQEGDPTVTYGNYSFKGTYVDYQEEENPDYYVLNESGDAFVKAVSTTYVLAYHAYFKAAVSGASASALKVDLDGTTTIQSGVSDEEDIIIYFSDSSLRIITDKAQRITVWGIDGRVVKQVELSVGENLINGLMPGIYVVNNQKVVIK